MQELHIYQTASNIIGIVHLSYDCIRQVLISHNLNSQETLARPAYKFQNELPIENIIYFVKELIEKSKFQEFTIIKRNIQLYQFL